MTQQGPPRRARLQLLGADGKVYDLKVESVSFSFGLEDMLSDSFPVALRAGLDWPVAAPGTYPDEER